MTLKIDIKMDNAAFGEDGEMRDTGTESARILRELADRIDGEICRVGDITPCIDLNGNKVGTAEVVA